MVKLLLAILSFFVDVLFLFFVPIISWKLWKWTGLLIFTLLMLIFKIGSKL